MRLFGGLSRGCSGCHDGYPLLLGMPLGRDRIRASLPSFTSGVCFQLLGAGAFVGKPHSRDALTGGTGAASTSLTEGQMRIKGIEEVSYNAHNPVA